MLNSLPHPLRPANPTPLASSNKRSTPASLCIQQPSSPTSVSTAKQHRQHTEAFTNMMQSQKGMRCASQLFTALSLLLTGFEVHQTHPVTTGGHILSKLTGETGIHSLNVVFKRANSIKDSTCISYS